MKKVLLVGDPGKVELQAIREALVEDFELAPCADAAAAIALLGPEREHTVAAVLLDRPADTKGARELIECVSSGNHFIFALPVLLLTDREHLEADAAFLSDTAVDCVEKPIFPALLRNRLMRGIAQVTSVSFPEFASMLTVLPASIYLKDTQGRYVFTSQLWHHFDTNGDPNWTVVGKTDYEVRSDKVNGKRALDSDLEVVRTGEGTSYLIEENADGNREFLQIIKEPIRAEDGSVRGIIALINNVTEQEQLRRELKRQSVTDALTGLYNRSYYSEYVETLNKPELFPLSILSMDCDGLKRVNDVCGHQAGDQYIRTSVMLLRSCLPKTSTLFRTGGDEFVAFLPNTDAGQAAAYADAMRAMAAQQVVRGNRLSVSIGLSTMDTPEESLADHFKRADENMYAEKEAKKADA